MLTRTALVKESHAQNTHLAIHDARAKVRATRYSTPRVSGSGEPDGLDVFRFILLQEIEPLLNVFFARLQMTIDRIQPSAE